MSNNYNDKEVLLENDVFAYKVDRKEKKSLIRALLRKATEHGITIKVRLTDLSVKAIMSLFKKLRKFYKNIKREFNIGRDAADNFFSFDGFKDDCNVKNNKKTRKTAYRTSDYRRLKGDVTTSTITSCEASGLLIRENYEKPIHLSNDHSKDDCVAMAVYIINRHTHYVKDSGIEDLEFYDPIVREKFSDLLKREENCKIIAERLMQLHFTNCCHHGLRSVKFRSGVDANSDHDNCALVIDEIKTHSADNPNLSVEKIEYNDGREHVFDGDRTPKAAMSFIADNHNIDGETGIKFIQYGNLYENAIDFQALRKNMGIVDKKPCNKYYIAGFNPPITGPYTLEKTFPGLKLSPENYFDTHSGFVCSKSIGAGFILDNFNVNDDYIKIPTDYC